MERSGDELQYASLNDRWKSYGKEERAGFNFIILYQRERRRRNKVHLCGLMDEENINEEPTPVSRSDPTEFLKMKPKKSILKSTSRQQTSPEQKGAHFDEMNILATLHPPDRDYGFMKIDEPKTPYNYMSEGELEDGPSDPQRRVSLCDVPNIDPSALQEMLSRQLRSSSPYSVEDSDTDSETEEQRAKRLEFEKKRKLHYNEFRAMQMAKERLCNDEDTDKEDEEQPSTTME